MPCIYTKRKAPSPNMGWNLIAAISIFLFSAPADLHSIPLESLFKGPWGQYLILRIVLMLAPDVVGLHAGIDFPCPLIHDGGF